MSSYSLGFLTGVTDSCAVISSKVIVNDSLHSVRTHALLMRAHFKGDNSPREWIVSWLFEEHRSDSLYMVPVSAAISAQMNTHCTHLARDFYVVGHKIPNITITPGSVFLCLRHTALNLLNRLVEEWLNMQFVYQIIVYVKHRQPIKLNCITCFPLGLESMRFEII